MFGKRLAEIRKKKELSQYELADRLGFSRGQIANYEQGKREPDYETLQKLADFFNVSTDYLLGRTDEPVPTKENKTPSDQKEGAENFFYFDLEGLNEEEKDLLHASYNAMRERARKRAAAKKKDEEK